MATATKSDIHLILGLNSIMNPENINPNIDLKDLERQMISAGLVGGTQSADPQAKFDEEIRRAVDKLGIDFDDLASGKNSPTSTHNENSLYDASSTQQDYLFNDSHAATSYFQTGAKYSDPTGYTPTVHQSAQQSSDDAKLASLTREQECREQIDSVLGVASGHSAFSFGAEKDESMKGAMLAEIGSLRLVLEPEEIVDIPLVDRNSDFGTVKSVLDILRYKNDNSRYCSVAEEFLLFGAHTLEELFDGKRTWMGKYQPDLTGWHNHVNVKLKRMRYDTSQLVSGVMQDYNIGPGARILLELVPSMFMYSRVRKQQHNEVGLFSDTEMADTNSRIRALT